MDCLTEEVLQVKKKLPIFKSSVFQLKCRPPNNSGKKKIWRSLKQVLAQERTLFWSLNVVHYSSINAPPILKPAKKYSDITGLPILLKRSRLQAGATPTIFENNIIIKDRSPLVHLIKQWNSLTDHTYSLQDLTYMSDEVYFSNGNNLNTKSTENYSI